MMNFGVFCGDKESVDIFLGQIEEEGLLISGMPLKYCLPDPNDEPESSQAQTT